MVVEILVISMCLSLLEDRVPRNLSGLLSDRRGSGQDERHLKDKSCLERWNTFHEIN